MRSPIGQGCLGVAAITPNRLAKREAGRGVAPGAPPGAPSPARVTARTCARRPHARGTQGQTKEARKQEREGANIENTRIAAPVCAFDFLFYFILILFSERWKPTDISIGTVLTELPPPPHRGGGHARKRGERGTGRGEPNTARKV